MVYVHIAINSEDVGKQFPFKMEKCLENNCNVSSGCITSEIKSIKATSVSNVEV